MAKPPLPTWPELRQLVYDPGRLEKLFRDALRNPINFSLPPVTIVGNEKGLADYYYLSFRLFGISLIGFWLLYFLQDRYYSSPSRFEHSPLALLLLASNVAYSSTD